MERMNVTIRKDQKEWLDRTPSINASGLLQEKIDEIMSILNTEGL